MSKKKSIAELLHPRKAAASRNAVSHDEVELAGMVNSAILESGEYQVFDITDGIIHDLTAMNALCYQAVLLRSELLKANLTGIQLPEGYIKDVRFEKCRINLSSLRKAQLERCLFIDCDLSEADFSGATCTNIRFENCKLDGCDFSNATCSRVEFSNTNLTAIKGVTGLKGATISELNLIELAPTLAKQLGLVIE